MATSEESQVGQMVDYIMKHCLWQFHSRKWDREKQNAGILGKLEQILCGEPLELATPADRCYWVDAVSLANAYNARFSWLAGMDTEAKRSLVRALHARIDYLTITASLNAELTDERY